MSAVYGYSVPFSVIADLHQDLNVGNAGLSEKVFTSGPTDDTQMTWQQWLDYVFFNKTYDLPSVVKDQIAKGIKAQEEKLPCQAPVNNTPTSCYDVVAADPRLSRFKWLLDYVNYGKVKDLDHPITLFAPVNDLFDKTLEYPLNLGVKSVSMLQVLRYHLLDYVIKPWQLENRRLKLRTDLEEQPVETDWTHGRRQLLNPISERVIYGATGYGTSGFGDPYPALPDDWFPKKTWEVLVLSVSECDGGIVYVISRPLIFPNAL